MVSNEKIIKKIRAKFPEGKGINAYLEKNQKGWVCNIMKSYSGGEGLGFIGATTFLDVQYTHWESAKKLEQLVNATFDSFE